VERCRRSIQKKESEIEGRPIDFYDSRTPSIPWKSICKALENFIPKCTDMKFRIYTIIILSSIDLDYKVQQEKRRNKFIRVVV